MAENLGTLNFDVTLTDKAQKSIENFKKTIDSVNGKNIDINLKGDALASLKQLKNDIESLRRNASDIVVNVRQGGNLNISNLSVEPAAVDALAKKITKALEAETIHIGKVDTREMRDAVARAINDAVNIGKGTIAERLKKALSGNVQKIKVNIDTSQIAQQIENVLGKKTIRVGNLTPNKNDLAESIRNALKGETFYINVAVRKNDVVSGVQESINNANATNNVANANNNAANAAQNHAKSQRSLNSEMKASTQIATILGNSLGNVFSAYQIKNFLEGVVQVGGELEKMKLAMGSIMGDTYKATEIFGQVSQLSMISPFDVQDLVQYSKQLNAFGIKYNELYDTTKRLSDIAAAVGVSFGRIAYEFGQTSARGWLDGRELRMFANSGIPLLNALSEYYTKTQGKVISSSQVREMVTKREVSFDDVKSVLWEMTDAGGQFYQMQEVMAESLAAKWRNLANDWNLMLGKIAESPIGNGLKGVAETLMKIVENWQMFGAAIVVVTSKTFLFAAAQKLSTMETTKATSAQVMFKTAIKNTGNAMKAMNTTANWVTLAITAVVFAIGHFVNKAQEAEDRMERVRDKASEGFRNLQEFMKSSAFTVPPVNDAEFKQSIDKMKEYIKDYAPDSGKILTSIFGDGKEEKGLETLREKYEALRIEMEKLEGSYKLLNLMRNLFNDANDATDGVWDESMTENLKDAEKRLSDFESRIRMFIKDNGLDTDKMLEDIRNSNADFAAAVVKDNGQLMSSFDQLKLLLTDYSYLLNSIDSDAFNKLKEGSWYKSIYDNSLIGRARAFNNAISDVKEDINQFADFFSRDYLEKAIPNFKEYSEDQQKQAIRAMLDASLSGIVSNKEIIDLVYDELIRRGILDPLTEFTDKNSKTPPADDLGKGDQLLEQWKEQARLIKEAYREYKKYYDLYKDHDKAAEMVRKNPMLSELEGIEDIDPSKIIDNYEKFLEKIRPLLNSDKRKKFALTVEGDKFDVGFDIDKDEFLKKAEEALSDVERDLSEKKDIFDFWKQMFEATGNSEYAQKFSQYLENKIRAMLGDTFDGTDLTSLFDMKEDEMLRLLPEDQKPQVKALIELLKQYKSTLNEEERKINDDFDEYVKTYVTAAKEITNRIAQYERDLNDAKDDISREKITASYKNDMLGLTNKYWQEAGEMFANSFLSKENLDKLREIVEQRRAYQNSEEFLSLPQSVRDSYMSNTNKLDGVAGTELSTFKDLLKLSKDAKTANNEYIDALNAFVEAVRKYEDAVEKFGKDSKEASSAKSEMSTAQETKDQAQARASVANNNASANYESQISKLGDISSAVGQMGSGIDGMYNGIAKLAGINMKGFGGVIGAVLQIVVQLVNLLQNNGENVEKMATTFGNNLNNVLKQGIIGTDEQAAAFKGSMRGIWAILGGFFDGILNSLTFGFFDKWIKAGDSDKRLTVALEKLAEQNEALKYSVDALTEIMSNQSVIDAADTYKKAVENIIKETENLQEQMMRSGAAYSNGVMGIGGHHSSNSHIDEGMKKKDWDAISKAAGVSVKNAAEFWGLTSEQMWNVATYAATEYAKIKGYANDGYKDAAKFMDDYIEQWKKLDDERKSFFEAMTGINYDQVYDGFVEMIRNLDATAYDFSKDFSKYMFDAVVNSMSAEVVQPMIDRWMRDFSRYMESDGGLDTNEVDILRNAWEGITEKGLNIREIAQEISGYGTDEGGLSSSIKGVTEDTAEIIAAYLNTVTANTTAIKDCEVLIAYDLLPTMSATAMSQLAQLEMQTAYLEAISLSNESIASRVISLEENVASVISGTKSFKMN